CSVMLFCVFLIFFFFFSSRRRHTRCYRDWSSDVCSSDLGEERPAADMEDPPCVAGGEQLGGVTRERRVERGIHDRECHERDRQEIGRASCRERVESSEGAGGL